MNTNLKQKSHLSKSERLFIAHSALTSIKPFYYVEEAQINGHFVDLKYFNENAEESETLSMHIHTTLLTDFIKDYYRNVVDIQVNGDHVQYEDGISPYTYLVENLDNVLKDFLNNAEVFHG